MFRYVTLTLSDCVSHLGDTLAIPAVVLAMHVAILVQLAVIAVYLLAGFSCKVHKHRPDVRASKGTN